MSLRDFSDDLKNLKRVLDDTFQTIETKFKHHKIAFFKSYKALYNENNQNEILLLNILNQENFNNHFNTLNVLLGLKRKQVIELKIYAQIIENKKKFSNFWNLLDLAKSYQDLLEKIVPQQNKAVKKCSNDHLCPYQAAIYEFEMNGDKLKNEITILKSENLSLRHQISSLQNNLNSLIIEKKQMETNILNLKETNNKMQLTDQILIKTQKENQDLKNKLSESLEKYENFEKQISNHRKLEKDNEILKYRAEILENEKSAVLKKFAISEREKESFLNKLEEFKLKYENEKLKYERVESEKNHKDNELRQIYEKLSKFEENYLLEKTKSNQEFLKHKKDFESQINSIQKNLTQQINLNKNYEIEIDRKQKALQDYEQNLESLKSKFFEELSVEKRTNLKIQEHLAVLQIKYDELKEENAILQNELSSTKTKKNEYENEISQLKEKIEFFENENDALKTKFNEDIVAEKDSNKSMMSLNIIIDSKTIENEQPERPFACFQSEIDIYKEENIKIKEVLNEISVKINEVRNYSVKKSDLENFEKFQHFNEKIVENENKLEILNEEEIRDLKKKFKKELVTNSNEIQTTQNEINSIIDSLKNQLFTEKYAKKHLELNKKLNFMSREGKDDKEKNYFSDY